MDKNSREYEVCVCRHVTRGQIEDYLKESAKTGPVSYTHLDVYKRQPRPSSLSTISRIRPSSCSMT